MFQPESERRSRPTSQLKGNSEEAFTVAEEEVGLLGLCRPSTDWTRPTHIRKSNLFYSIYPFKC